MTDKQIIIDGVDVNDCHNRTFYKNDEGDVQCKCYRFEDADSDTLLFGICKQHPHCYYKQLKRKEQECEELKIYIESNEQQVKEVETLVMDNDRLINELDQLKAENEELKKNYFTVIQQRNKAEKTLTEIKEIAMGIMDNDLEESSAYYDAKQILQKISECEGNDVRS